jgi:gas vesicle protein
MTSLPPDHTPAPGPITGEHRVPTGEYPATHPQTNWVVLFRVLKLTGITLGIIVVIGGIIGTAFASYYGLQTRDSAKEDLAVIVAEAKEKRIEIRKEAKEERLLMKDELKELLDKHHAETREDIKELRDEIRAVNREVRRNRGEYP